MHVRQIVRGIVLGGLVSSPAFALAQGCRHGMGRQDGRGHASDSMPQMEPVLQQLRACMDPMAAQSQAGPLTPDATRPLRAMMEQMTVMMATLGRGTRGSDTATPRAGLRTWWTERHTGLAALLGASSPEEPEAEGRAPRLGK